MSDDQEYEKLLKSAAKMSIKMFSRDKFVAQQPLGERISHSPHVQQKMLKDIGEGSNLRASKLKDGINALAFWRCCLEEGINPLHLGIEANPWCSEVIYPLNDSAEVLEQSCKLIHQAINSTDPYPYFSGYTGDLVSNEEAFVLFVVASQTFYSMAPCLVDDNLRRIFINNLSVLERVGSPKFREGILLFITAISANYEYGVNFIENVEKKSKRFAADIVEILSTVFVNDESSDLTHYSDFSPPPTSSLIIGYWSQPQQKNIVSSLLNSPSLMCQNIAFDLLKDHTQLIKSCCHDLNNPVLTFTSLVRYLESLSGEENQEKIKEYAEILNLVTLQLDSTPAGIFDFAYLNLGFGIIFKRAGILSDNYPIPDHYDQQFFFRSASYKEMFLENWKDRLKNDYIELLGVDRFYELVLSELKDKVNTMPGGILSEAIVHYFRTDDDFKARIDTPAKIKLVHARGVTPVELSDCKGFRKASREIINRGLEL